LIFKPITNPAVASVEIGDIQSKGNNSQKRDPCTRKELKELSFKHKHASALAHTLSEILKEHGCRKVDLESRLRNYYIDKFNFIEMIDLLSQIKLSISILFSRRTRQEMPEGSSFALIPHFIMKWFRVKTGIQNSRRIVGKYRLLHSILQMKAVLPGPSRCHIEKSYQKHSLILSSEPKKTPDAILRLAYEKGKEIGKIICVNKLYNPFHCPLPSSSATLDAKRDEGGQFAQLMKTTKSDFAAFRVEPTVLFISGDPGKGKSRIVSNLVRRIAILEKYNLKNCVFTRNCNIPHWDGYNGNPIVVLDDWGQSRDPQDDRLELVSLVTDNCYPLPMAELKEKGTIFNSKYIILCSNLSPFMASQLNKLKPSVSDLRAVIRRLHHSIYIEDARHSDTVRFLDVTHHLKKLSTSDNPFQDITIGHKSDFRMEVSSRSRFVLNVSKRLVDDQRKRQEGLLSDFPEISSDYPWVQNVIDIDEKIHLDNFDHSIKVSKNIYFPQFPSTEQLPEVRTVSVAKALGSRMVTCASANVRVLKPLQVALWKALGYKKQFAATHGVTMQNCIELLEFPGPDDFLLSGDYESATDNMNMDLSNEILFGILSEIDHEPTKAWCIYENGKHIIHYPLWTQISPIEQTVGQLMGSLLSFPLLCLANDVITSFVGIENKQINGDDLLCYTSKEKINHWRLVGKQCGLEPSIGKNFVSKIFGTFNSQLIVNRQHISHTNCKLVLREFQKLSIESCFEQALKDGVSKRMLVRNNHSLLKQTPRSIDIPSSHGGLGRSFDKKVSQMDKLCYLFDLTQKKNKAFLPSELLPKEYLWLTYPKYGKNEPKLILPAEIEDHFLKGNFNSKFGLLSNLQTVSAMTKQPIKERIPLSLRTLSSLKKDFMKCKELREFLFNGDLKLCPKLNEIQWITIPCKRSSWKNVQSRIVTEFLNLPACA